MFYILLLLHVAFAYDEIGEPAKLFHRFYHEIFGENVWKAFNVTNSFKSDFRHFWTFNQLSNTNKVKRQVAGALHIMTNNADPIRADVKTDVPAMPNIHEKVTPPEDTAYEPRSLRKSLNVPNHLDLIRSISRVTTLFVLLFTAVVEFYPVLKTLTFLAYRFIYL